MPDSETLSHTTWACKYHGVFIPQYRRQALDHEVRRHLGEVFRALAAQKAGRIEEGPLLADHVPMLLSMPPQYSVAQVVGFLKGKAAIHIARTFLGRRKHSTGHHCWARGDSVATVGRDEAVIREYIRTHEAAERRLDQMDLWEEGPPVGGSHPNRFERFTASTALSDSTFFKPPALPEVADCARGFLAYRGRVDMVSAGVRRKRIKSQMPRRKPYPYPR
jgi:putative transposase